MFKIGTLCRPGANTDVLARIKVEDGLFATYSMVKDFENVKDMKTVGRARLVQKPPKE